MVATVEYVNFAKRVRFDGERTAAIYQSGFETMIKKPRRNERNGKTIRGGTK